MSQRLTIKLVLCAALIVVAGLLASSPEAFAQCAMCKTALSNSPEAAKLAERFNFAVLVLLIPPVLLFCGIFYAAYKYRKAPGQEAEEGGGLNLPRLWLSKLSGRLRRKKQNRRETGGALV